MKRKITRSRLKRTVSALKASPLWNFTPGTRLNDQVLESGVTVQLCASSGPTLPSGRIFVSVSKTL
jgi:hypothetical protein